MRATILRIHAHRALDIAEKIGLFAGQLLGTLTDEEMAQVKPGLSIAAAELTYTHQRICALVEEAEQA